MIQGPSASSYSTKRSSITNTNIVSTPLNLETTVSFESNSPLLSHEMPPNPAALLTISPNHSAQLVTDILLTLSPTATIPPMPPPLAQLLLNARTHVTFAYFLSCIEGCEIEFCDGTSGFEWHPCVEHKDL
jgi:hypothetical protein